MNEKAEHSVNSQDFNLSSSLANMNSTSESWDGQTGEDLKSAHPHNLYSAGTGHLSKISEYERDYQNLEALEPVGNA